VRPVPTYLRAKVRSDGNAPADAPDARCVAEVESGDLIAAATLHLPPMTPMPRDSPAVASSSHPRASAATARIARVFNQARNSVACVNFRPVFSFSIRRFSYDRQSRRLLVDYFDGRQSICADVPPLVVAVLQGSSTPETVLQRYAQANSAALTSR